MEKIDILSLTPEVLGQHLAELISGCSSRFCSSFGRYSSTSGT